MCLAPATRVGYVVYPVNLLVWSWLFERSAEERATATLGEGAVEPAVAPRG